MAGSFVKVRGYQLVLNDTPYVFAGGNCYYLAVSVDSMPGHNNQHMSRRRMHDKDAVLPSFPCCYNQSFAGSIATQHT
jgi:hypothetical protein